MQRYKQFNKLRNYRPNDLFSQDEVLELINACDHPRDKAVIAVLYDALRPHEAIKIRPLYSILNLPTTS